MKKLTLAVTCLALVMSMTLVGCGKKADTPAGTSDPNANVSTNKDTKDNNVKTSPVVKTIVDQAQSQISTMKSSLGDTLDIAITAKGNSVVYTYTYLVDVGDISAVKTELEKAMDTQKATFETIVQSLKSAKVDSPSVIIEYVSKDGEMIYTKEFK